MADIVTQKNIGALLRSVIASPFVSATAGGSGDATAVTGATVDRLDPLTGSLALSARFAVAWSTVLTAAKTLSLGTVAIYQSADGFTWDATAYATFTDPSVVATGAGTKTGVTAFDVDLSSAKRYVRIAFTPDLSNTATDTASLVAVATLAGHDRLPA